MGSHVCLQRRESSRTRGTRSRAHGMGSRSYREQRVPGWSSFQSWHRYVFRRDNEIIKKLYSGKKILKITVLVLEIFMHKQSLKIKTHLR